MIIDSKSKKRFCWLTTLSERAKYGARYWAKCDGSTKIEQLLLNDEYVERWSLAGVPLYKSKKGIRTPNRAPVT